MPTRRPPGLPSQGGWSRYAPLSRPSSPGDFSLRSHVDIGGGGYTIHRPNPLLKVNFSSSSSSNLRLNRLPSSSNLYPYLDSSSYKDRTTSGLSKHYSGGYDYSNSPSSAHYSSRHYIDNALYNHTFESSKPPVSPHLTVHRSSNAYENQNYDSTPMSYDRYSDRSSYKHRYSQENLSHFKTDNSDQRLEKKLSRKRDEFSSQVNLYSAVDTAGEGSKMSLSRSSSLGNIYDQSQSFSRERTPCPDQSRVSRESTPSRTEFSRELSENLRQLRERSPSLKRSDSRTNLDSSGTMLRTPSSLILSRRRISDGDLKSRIIVLDRPILSEQKPKAKACSRGLGLRRERPLIRFRDPPEFNQAPILDTKKECPPKLIRSTSVDSGQPSSTEDFQSILERELKKVANKENIRQRSESIEREDGNKEFSLNEKADDCMSVKREMSEKRARLRKALNALSPESQEEQETKQEPPPTPDKRSRCRRRKVAPLGNSQEEAPTSAESNTQEPSFKMESDEAIIINGETSNQHVTKDSFFQKSSNGHLEKETPSNKYLLKENIASEKLEPNQDEKCSVEKKKKIVKKKDVKCESEESPGNADVKIKFKDQDKLKDIKMEPYKEPSLFHDVGKQRRKIENEASPVKLVKAKNEEASETLINPNIPQNDKPSKAPGDVNPVRADMDRKPTSAIKKNDEHFCPNKKEETLRGRKEKIKPIEEESKNKHANIETRRKEQSSPNNSEAPVKESELKWKENFEEKETKENFSNNNLLSSGSTREKVKEIQKFPPSKGAPSKEGAQTDNSSNSLIASKRPNENKVLKKESPNAEQVKDNKDNADKVKNREKKPFNDIKHSNDSPNYLSPSEAKNEPSIPLSKAQPQPKQTKPNSEDKAQPYPKNLPNHKVKDEKINSKLPQFKPNQNTELSPKSKREVQTVNTEGKTFQVDLRNDKKMSRDDKSNRHESKGEDSSPYNGVSLSQSPKPKVYEKVDIATNCKDKEGASELKKEKITPLKGNLQSKTNESENMEPQKDKLTAKDISKNLNETKTKDTCHHGKREAQEGVMSDRKPNKNEKNVCKEDYSKGEDSISKQDTKEKEKIKETKHAFSKEPKGLIENKCLKEENEVNGALLKNKESRDINCKEKQKSLAKEHAEKNAKQTTLLTNEEKESKCLYTIKSEIPKNAEGSLEAKKEAKNKCEAGHKSAKQPLENNLAENRETINKDILANKNKSVDKNNNITSHPFPKSNEKTEVLYISPPSQLENANESKKINSLVPSKEMQPKSDVKEDPLIKEIVATRSKPLEQAERKEDFPVQSPAPYSTDGDLTYRKEKVSVKVKIKIKRKSKTSSVESQSPPIEDKSKALIMNEEEKKMMKVVNKEDKEKAEKALTRVKKHPCVETLRNEGELLNNPTLAKVEKAFKCSLEAKVNESSPLIKQESQQKETKVEKNLISKAKIKVQGTGQGKISFKDTHKIQDADKEKSSNEVKDGPHKNDPESKITDKVPSDGVSAIKKVIKKLSSKKGPPLAKEEAAKSNLNGAIEQISNKERIKDGYDSDSKILNDPTGTSRKAIKKLSSKSNLHKNVDVGKKQENLEVEKPKQRSDSIGQSSDVNLGHRKDILEEKKGDISNISEGEKPPENSMPSKEETGDQEQKQENKTDEEPKKVKKVKIVKKVVKRVVKVKKKVEKKSTQSQEDPAENSAKEVKEGEEVTSIKSESSEPTALRDSVGISGKEQISNGLTSSGLTNGTLGSFEKDKSAATLPNGNCKNDTLSLDKDASAESCFMSRSEEEEAWTPAKLRFKKYSIDNFNFLKVLGRGSFGKVMLAELKGTNQCFAIKCLKKNVVLEDRDVESTMIERKVLTIGTSHPYICNLFCTFQSPEYLYFVMEYLCGGDIMFHILQNGRFKEDRARFYGAEVVSALKFLHKRGIVYRDAKLDNLVLDHEGHVRLVDFGMCKLHIYKKECLPRNLAGTPDYMAPEVILGRPYNHSIDWWSFGVLLYEMLVGQSPFKGTDEDELFWCICNEQPYYPYYLSKDAKHILKLFMHKDPETRLGMPDCPEGDVTWQPFFQTIDWEKLERKELEPPFKPQVRGPSDVSYFDSDFTEERPILTPTERPDEEGQQMFKGFSYTNPNTTE